MGRSSKEQAEANRNRIVDEAGRLFRSRGYDAVGIADVMKAAGMTQGGFYKHFPSKEALAVDALAAGFEEAATYWREQCHGNDETPLVPVVDFYLSSKPPEYHCPMVAHGEEAARLEKGHHLRDAYVVGARSLFEAFMRKGEDGVDPARARLLFAAMIGANLLGRVSDGGDTQWIDDLKATVAQAAQGAVRDRASEPPARPD